MGCEVEVVGASHIKNGYLDRFDVLACPGGATRPNPWEELGSGGKSQIQAFIKNGGGYIGICFGALYASDYCESWGVRIGECELYLELFSGIAYCGQEKIAPQGGFPL